jgi:hypothetical protein
MTELTIAAEKLATLEFESQLRIESLTRYTSDEISKLFEAYNAALKKLIEESKIDAPTAAIRRVRGNVLIKNIRKLQKRHYAQVQKLEAKQRAEIVRWRATDLRNNLREAIK